MSWKHLATSTLLAILLAAAPRESRAVAGEPEWRLYGSPTSTYPFPLYDPTRRRMLLLGDNKSMSGITVWASDLDTTLGWAPLETTGTPPLQGANHWPIDLAGAVIDARRDRLVTWGYFAGGASGSASGTFALSLETLVWTQLCSGSPQEVGTAFLLDEAGDRVLSYGGYWSSGVGSTYASKAVRVLDLSNPVVWTTLTVAGPLPTACAFSALALDSRRNRAILHGGEYVQTAWPRVLAPVDEAWELTLGPTPTWRFLTPVAPLPTARYSAYAVYDSLLDRVVLMGGTDANGGSLGADLWALDASDTLQAKWTHLRSMAMPSPAPTALVLDPVRREIVAGGGRSMSPLVGPKYYSMGGRFHSTLAGPGDWTTAIPPRDHPATIGAVALDAYRDRIVMAGPPTYSDAELWVWAAPLYQPLKWTRLAVGVGARRSCSAVVDPARDRLMIFGGVTAEVAQNTIAVTPLAGGAITALATAGAGPAGRQKHGAVFDVPGDRMIVFGGMGYGAHPPYFGDVWQLALSPTPTWSRLDAPGGGPGGRQGSRVFLDSVGNQLLVFGGGDSLGTYQDMWAFALDAHTWTRLYPGGTAPTVEPDMPMSFDAAGRRLLLTARDVLNPGVGTQLYALDLDGGFAWTPLQVGGFGPRGIPTSAIYDPARNMLATTGASDLSSQIQAVFLSGWTTPVAVSVVTASADADGVHLEWLLDGVTGPVTVERSEQAQAWRDLVTLLPDGRSRVRVRDADVEGGRTYEYRLRVSEAGSTSVFGLTSVAVPVPGSGMRLSLFPNPVSGMSPVVVHMRGLRGSARLEWFDVTGRRQGDLPMPESSAEAGGTWRLESPSRAGLYLARVVQGSRVLATCRFVVIR